MSDRSRHDSREQRDVDRDLREIYVGVTEPALSLHFNRNLRTQLYLEQRRKQSRRRARLGMLCYWIVAGLASALILMRISWPSELPSTPFICVLGATAAAALLTPVLLMRNLRSVLPNLVVGTIKALRP